MALGVYVSCEDLDATEALSNALDAADDLFLASAADRADVVIATPSELEGVPPGPAVVVLALQNPLPAAREALARGADGILGWPGDEALLSLSLHEAAARRTREETARGRIVSVVGARGGAGATTVAAYLARAMDALLVDLAGGPAGQAIYAPGTPPSTLDDLTPLLREITADAVTRTTHEHASGVPCLYGGPSPAAEVGRLPAALREAADVTVVDGFLPGAEVMLVVVSPDVGAVRAASELPDASIVLNRATRRGVRVADVERALGRKPVAVVPDEPRIARAADLGRLVSRGESVRRFRRLAKQVRGLLA